MASASKVDIWNRALDRIGHTDTLETEDDAALAARVCRQHYGDCLGEVLETWRWPFATKHATLSSVALQAATYAYDAALSDTNFSIPFAFLSSTQVAVTKDGTALVVGTDYNVLQGDIATGDSAQVVLVVALTAGESITITVTTTREGWEYLYTLPADCVRPVALLVEDQRYDLTAVQDRNEFAILSNDAGDGQLLCTGLEQGTDFEVLEYTAEITHVPAYPRQFIDALVWRLAVELAFALKRDEPMANRNMQRYLASVDKARVNQRNTNTRSTRPEFPNAAARG